MKDCQPRLALQALLLSTSVLALAPAMAERADRDKPVNLEADRISVDDARKVHILEGNVVLVRGTLTIRTDKLVVSQDADGFQKGVAHGGPGGVAHFRQKREGRDEYVEGEAERIEHDARTEKTEFHARARVKSGLDEVRGHYISYDGRSENYLVTAAPSAAGDGSSGSRVRAVIQPKKDGKAVAPDPSVPALKPSAEIQPSPGASR